MTGTYDLVGSSEPGCVNPVDVQRHRAFEGEESHTSTGPTRAGSPQVPELRDRLLRVGRSTDTHDSLGSLRVAAANRSLK